MPSVLIGGLGIVFLFQAAGMQLTVNAPALAFLHHAAELCRVGGGGDAGVQKHLVHDAAAEGDLAAGADFGLFPLVDIGKIGGGGADIDDQNGLGTQVHMVADRVGLNRADHDGPGLGDDLGTRKADGFKDALIALAGTGIPAGGAADIDAVRFFTAGQRTAAAERLKHAGREIADQGGAVRLGVQKAALEAGGAAHGGRGGACCIFADADLPAAHDGPDGDGDLLPVHLDDFGNTASLAGCPGQRALTVAQVKTPIIHHKIHFPPSGMSDQAPLKSGAYFSRSVAFPVVRSFPSVSRAGRRVAGVLRVGRRSNISAVSGA